MKQLASFDTYTADLAALDAQISFSLRGTGGTLDFTAGISGQNLVEVRDAGLTSAIYVTGSVNADRLFGSAFKDRLSGGEGDDVLLSGDGRDTLVGGANNDRLNGGSGNDILTVGAGDDASSIRPSVVPRTSTASMVLRPAPMPSKLVGSVISRV